MFYHQKVARVRVFADIQNFALRAHCVHGMPYIYFSGMVAVLPTLCVFWGSERLLPHLCPLSVP